MRAMDIRHSRQASIPSISAVLRRRVVCLLCTVGVLLAGTLPLPATAAAIDQLREFAAGTKAARGEFTQQAVRTNGRLGEVSTGSFAFQRPGRFRWEVLRPYEQLIVTDGDRMHFYDKDLRQVTVRKIGDSLAATPAEILFGSNDLDASFNLKEAGAAGGLEWL
jgi:outer membrane lipoprotein carrier protein